MPPEKSPEKASAKKTHAVELVAGPNAAQFAHPATGEQIELAAGETLELKDERHARNLVADYDFLKAV